MIDFHKNRAFYLKIITFISIITLIAFIGISSCSGSSDMYPPDNDLTDQLSKFMDTHFFDGYFRASPAQNSVVGICQSDDSSLTSPKPINVDVSTAEVEETTRKSIERAGGLDSIIKQNDWVLIKTNLFVTAKSEAHPGICADLRIVRTVVKMLIEQGRARRITIGEGGATYMDNSGMKSEFPEYGNLSVDGIVQELSKTTTIPVEWINFNLSKSSPYTKRDVPGGGLSFSSYSIPDAVVNCDKFIIVSALKTHKMGRVTMTVKNYMGISPAEVYGVLPGVLPFAHIAIPHGIDMNEKIDYANTLDRSLCDLYSYHPADFAIVGGFWGSEEDGADAGYGIQRNIVFSGSDGLAVDAVGTYYMGFNPYDIDYLHWCWSKGYGNTFDLKYITINGPYSGPAISAIDRLRANYGLTDFQKPVYNPYQGRGIRWWLVNGPHKGKKIDTDLLGGIETNIEPRQGDITSGKTWKLCVSYSDYIDLMTFLDAPSSCMTYAYANIIAEKAMSNVELRFASDNGIKVWLNGVNVFTDGSTGKFPSGYGKPWYQNSVKVNLNEGSNRLLVKIYNSSGAYGFSMYVSEVDGDTPMGLKYAVTPDGSLPAKP